MRSHEDIIGTLVHETSHIIVADYGEHPGTKTDAGSFDRYRDEFRAYFVEPDGPYSALAPDDRADRDPQPPGRHRRGHRHLRRARRRLLGDAARHQHVPRPGPRPPPPDGFNLDNSPYLDRLVHLLRDQQAGRATVEDDALPGHRPLPRRAHRGGRRDADRDACCASCPPPTRDRIRRALTSPAAVGFGRELNPDGSPRVTAFLEAVTTPHARGDHRRLPALRRHRPRQPLRQRPLPLVARARAAERDRDADLRHRDGPRPLVPVLRAHARAADRAAPTRRARPTMPEPLRAALRGLTFEARLAYIGLCREDYDARAAALQRGRPHRGARDPARRPRAVKRPARRRRRWRRAARLRRDRTGAADVVRDARARRPARVGAQRLLRPAAADAARARRRRADRGDPVRGAALIARTRRAEDPLGRARAADGTVGPKIRRTRRRHGRHAHRQGRAGPVRRSNSRAPAAGPWTCAGPVRRTGCDLRTGPPIRDDRSGEGTDPRGARRDRLLRERRDSSTRSSRSKARTRRATHRATSTRRTSTATAGRTSCRRNQDVNTRVGLPARDRGLHARRPARRSAPGADEQRHGRRLQRRRPSRPRDLGLRLRQRASSSCCATPAAASRASRCRSAAAAGRGRRG